MESYMPTTDDDLDLDVSFVESGLQAAGIASEDCTSDNCTGTNDSAGVTC